MFLVLSWKGWDMVLAVRSMTLSSSLGQFAAGDGSGQVFSIRDGMRYESVVSRREAWLIMSITVHRKDLVYIDCRLWALRTCETCFWQDVIWQLGLASSNHLDFEYHNWCSVGATWSMDPLLTTCVYQWKKEVGDVVHHQDPGNLSIPNSACPETANLDILRYTNSSRFFLVRLGVCNSKRKSGSFFTNSCFRHLDMLMTTLGSFMIVSTVIREHVLSLWIGEGTALKSRSVHHAEGVK